MLTVQALDFQAVAITTLVPVAILLVVLLVLRGALNAGKNGKALDDAETESVRARRQEAEIPVTVTAPLQERTAEFAEEHFAESFGGLRSVIRAPDETRSLDELGATELPETDALRREGSDR
jgi:hypothetical protein